VDGRKPSGHAITITAPGGFPARTAAIVGGEYNSPRGQKDEGSMEFTINSRTLKRQVTFSIPGSGYIFVDLNGQPGSLGSQICAGGMLIGNTISYSGENDKTFARICRGWFRAYLRGSAWERKAALASSKG
jgi:hypothetical protein